MRSSTLKRQQVAYNHQEEQFGRRTDQVSPGSSPMASSEPDIGFRSPLAIQQPISLIPREGWTPFLLLGIALYSVVMAVVAMNWVDHSTFLYWSPLPGLVMGFFVAKIVRFPQSLLHLTSCLLGYVFSIWLTSTLAFHQPWTSVVDGLIAAFSGQLATLDPGTGQMVFFFYLAFLCFFLGYFGSWLIYRAHLPWLVALVYFSIMLVDLNYATVAENNLYFLTVVLAGALMLLVARMHLAIQIAHWTHEGLYTDREWLRKITGRCMQIACLLTVLALPLSWLLPMVQQPDSGKVFWNQLDNAWTNVLGGNFDLHNLGSLTSSNQPASNFFGTELNVTGSVNLPEGQILSYQSSDQQGHYLESLSYDFFNGHTWTTSMGNMHTSSYEANAELPVEASKGVSNDITTTVHFDQAVLGSKNFVFAPAQPIHFSMPVSVLYAGNADSQVSVAWTQQPPLVQGSSYQVVSALSTSNVSFLQEAPLPLEDPAYWEEDPAYSYWLNSLYMQVPTDLSPTVIRTVENWTQGANNSYDALMQIEAHFTDTHVFSYSINNGDIPANEDVVDWLLQNKVGYCTHYATAMAIMGRLLHIPTRVVSGFSQGTYDQTHNDWTVQGTDAHSWVQAYFPAYGWVNFDPTPGYSLSNTSTPQKLLTPIATQPVTHPSPTPVPHTNKQQPQPTTPQQHTSTTSHVISGVPSLPWIWLFGIFGLLVVVCLFVVIMQRRWNQQLAGHSVISGIFWRIGRIARWSGLGPRSWQTPYEYAEMLSQYLPRERSSIFRLTDLYVRERWGSFYQAPLHQEEEVAAHTWSTLRTMLLRLIFRRRNS